MMNISPTITPPFLTGSITSCCRQINEDYEPVYVDVRPMPYSLPNKCPYNVKRYVDENGGLIVFGWALFIWPKVLLDCIGHAVIENADGNLLCITPNKNGSERILFLRDDKIQFDYNDPNARVGAMQLPLRSDKKIIEIIRISKEIRDIKTKYPVTSGNMYVSAEDGAMIKELEKLKGEIVGKILMEITGPNDPCPCGSRRKYKRCCKPFNDRSN
jgi:hypothetical protein